jgi:uncharacterized protein YoxC
LATGSTEGGGGIAEPVNQGGIGIIAMIIIRIMIQIKNTALELHGALKGVAEIIHRMTGQVGVTSE